MNDQTSHLLRPPGFVFLGLCGRANYVREGNTNIFHWNILGLRNIILSHIFPLKLDSWSIGFAFHRSAAGPGNTFRVADEHGTKIGIISLSAKLDSLENQDIDAKTQTPLLQVSSDGWTAAFVPLVGMNFVIPKPGSYFLEHLTEGRSTKVGEVHFALVDPAPLTSDRVAAIKSDPNAAKAVRIEFGCKHCSSKERAYAALERNGEMEREGWVWYQDIPARFTCQCNKTMIDLQYVRRNLHGMLGGRIHSSDQIDLVPLYHASALRATRSNFLHLISRDVPEETLQKFINDNPILLHQFPSLRVITKPRILISHAADFGIVTPAKEFLLVELEKSSTRLMKKDGGIAAPLSHAFDQVRSWLHVIDEHRLAVLNSLNIPQEEVSLVRGIVIAGRDVGYDARDLRKLKGANWGRITLLTYDDLLFALDALIERVETL